MRAAHSLQRGAVVAGAIVALFAAHAQGAEIQFRCNHESNEVKSQYGPGDPVPFGGYAVDIGWMQTYTEDAYFVSDPSCDPLSTLAIVVDGTDRVGEIHGVHTGPEPPNKVYDFKVQIGAERTDIFGARFGSQSASTGYQFFFVEFGGDGNMWIMGESTGIAYKNIFASDCQRGIDNRVKVGWKMNLADNRLDVTIQTFGVGAVKKTFGPYSIPEPLLTEGWSRCIYQVPPNTGRYYFDGVKCASTSPPEFEPVPGRNRTRR